MSYAESESRSSRSHSHNSATGADAAAAGAADPASVTAATLIDDDEYAADRADRTGLPVIPRGAPPAGDTIDVSSIQREYANRAVRRSSPLATTQSIPLRSIASSERQQQQQQQQQQEEDEVSRRRDATMQCCIDHPRMAAAWMMLLLVLRDSSADLTAA